LRAARRAFLPRYREIERREAIARERADQQGWDAYGRDAYGRQASPMAFAVPSALWKKVA